VNTPQRIVLIIGALVLLFVLTNTQYHDQYDGIGRYAILNHVWDWKSALVRCAILSVIIAAVYFAFSEPKQK
jgi:hypothetical protein